MRVEQEQTQSAAIEVLKGHGYVVRLEGDSLADHMWTAETEGRLLAASDPMGLLGLHEIAEARGVDWPIASGERDPFLVVTENDGWMRA